MLRKRSDIPLKAGRDIEKMRAAGAVVAESLERCAQAIRPGMTTAELDAVADQCYTRAGGVSLFKNYPGYRPGAGFPGNTCISVNEEIVHGVPGERIIRDGDVVTIDCGVKIDGWCGDSAITVGVGRVSPRRAALIDATRALLELAIDMVRPGRLWSDIAREMERVAIDGGYGVVKEFVGHGIGRRLHEAPRIPNYISPEMMREDFILQPGMTLAIEPMLTLGSAQTQTLRDRWTVITSDRSVAAHVEHTIAVTRRGADVLTALRGV